MRKLSVFLVLMLFTGLSVMAQRTITGVVTSSEDGHPIPGASILVKGTTLGTTTDLNGKYSLTVNDNAKYLLFRFVGMVSKEVQISSSTMNVTLDPDVLNIEGVVVTAIGIKREAKALGYSMQSVDAEEIMKGNDNNVVNALSGKVAGVQINSSSGAAGGSSYVTIRGAASIIGNNQPLFIVDGVPIDNSGGEGGVDGVALSNRAFDINPDDIASVSVLKGGAATALYGIRAANGAILITTKDGSSANGEKITVNLNSSVSFDYISQVPKLNTKYGQGLFGNWSSGNFASWGPRLDTSYWIPDPNQDPNHIFDVDGILVGPGQAGSNGTPVTPYDQYDFFQTGMTLNNSLSFAGGGSNANYYASVSDMRQEGIVPNNIINKNTFLIKGEANLSKSFKVSGSANYMSTRGDRIQQGSNTSGVMLGLLRTPPSFNNAAGYVFEDGTQRNYRAGGGYDNPYWTANKNLYQDDVNRLVGNTGFLYTPADWVNVSYRLGIDVYSRSVNSYLAKGSRTFSSGQVFTSNTTSRDINSDLIITFKHDINDDLHFKGLIGNNMQDRYSYFVSGQADGIELPDFYHLSNTNNVATNNGTYHVRRAGFFGEAELAYKNMLYLNVTGRNDWSTTLPKEHNSFFYPSVSGSFIFTELNALEDIKHIISYGKVRASYAQIAADAPAYRTTTYYGKQFISDGWVSPSGIQFPFNGLTAFTLSNTLGNNELKPERTTTWEVGLDMKFLNNRIGFDLAYFNSLSEDLLMPVSVAPSTGYNEFFLNAGSMSNNGIELLVYGQPVKTKDFKWDVTVNFTKINNNVISLADNVDNIFLGGFVDPQIRAVEDLPYRSIFGYDWLRDDNGNVIIDDDVNSSSYGFPRGDYTMKALGDVNPDWTMGITNEFSYRGVSLSFLVDIKQGGMMWNGTRGALYYFGAHADTETREPDDLFVFDGVLESTGKPNNIEVVKDMNWYILGEGSGFTGPTVDFIEETSWVRLRHLTLSYTLPAKLFKGKFVKALSVYATGKNLWLSTPYTGIDPETSLMGASNAQGMDYFNMPGTRSYLFGLKASF